MHERRTSAGLSLVVVAALLFSMLGWYFLHLVRPIDFWDWVPALLLLAGILIGARLCGVHLLRSIIGSTTKKIVLLSFATGSTVAVALNVLLNAVSDPARIENYTWLSDLHSPARALALKVGALLYPTVGFPWSVRLAVACGYAVLIGQWTAAILILSMLSRLILRAFRPHSTVQS
jgi:hypothetical protein